MTSMFGFGVLCTSRRAFAKVSLRCFDCQCGRYKLFLFHLYLLQQHHLHGDVYLLFLSSVSGECCIPSAINQCLNQFPPIGKCPRCHGIHRIHFLCCSCQCLTLISHGGVPLQGQETTHSPADSDNKGTRHSTDNTTTNTLLSTSQSAATPKQAALWRGITGNTRLYAERTVGGHLFKPAAQRSFCGYVHLQRCHHSFELLIPSQGFYTIASQEMLWKELFEKRWGRGAIKKNHNASLYWKVHLRRKQLSNP